MANHPTRRRLLAATAAGGATVAVAGCTDEPNGDGGSNGSDGGSGPDGDDGSGPDGDDGSGFDGSDDEASSMTVEDTEACELAMTSLEAEFDGDYETAVDLLPHKHTRETTEEELLENIRTFDPAEGTDVTDVSCECSGEIDVDRFERFSLWREFDDAPEALTELDLSFVLDGASRSRREFSRVYHVGEIDGERYVYHTGSKNALRCGSVDGPHAVIGFDDQSTDDAVEVIVASIGRADRLWIECDETTRAELTDPAVGDRETIDLRGSCREAPIFVLAEFDGETSIAQTYNDHLDAVQSG